MRHLRPFRRGKRYDAGWRRVHARYDRYAHTFLSAIAIIAIVWI